MKVDNKVEPISTIDIESKTLYLDQFKEFASNPDTQIIQKNVISQPIADQLNVSTIKPSTQKAFALKSHINQENEISLLHYFSWVSDLFLSIFSMGVLAIIPMHNMLEEPSYW